MSLSDTVSNILYTIKKFVYDKTSADAKFVKYTDTPTTSKAGPVKAGNWLSIDDGGTNKADRGKMKCGELTLEQYQTCKGYTFISKTTLENALIDKGYLTSASLNGYAKTSDIPSLTDYAKKTDIPDVSNFITASALDNLALKNEIPDVSGFITETQLNNKGYLTSASLTNYVKQEDLTGFASKRDIPSLDGYATENWVDTQGFLKSITATFTGNSVTCKMTIDGKDVDMSNIMTYILANIENAEDTGY